MNLSNYEHCIFINCPYDESYINDFLKPILYVSIKNGLYPRLALESSDARQFRLQKITELLKACKYSIHDISILKSQKAGEYARMNMPFELGVDYGLRVSGVKKFSSKQFLVLVSAKQDFQKAVSDLVGFDPKYHNRNTLTLVECIQAWFSETLNLHSETPASMTFSEYIEFNASLFEKKAKELKSDNLAKEFIESMTIPHYMVELETHFNLNK
jgi:hypothetical protein